MEPNDSEHILCLLFHHQHMRMNVNVIRISDKISTHLYVSREREILPEGMALEAVVCQDTPQVWVVSKEHTKHVPHLNPQTQCPFICILPRTELNTPDLQAQTHLPLIPVGSGVDWNCRVHGGQLIRVRLDTNTRIIAQRQQVIHDL